MTFRASRQAALSLVLATILGGCTLAAVPTGPGGKPGTGTGGSTGSTGGGTGTVTPGGTLTPGEGPVHNVPLEPLNGIEFKPIDASTSKFIASNGGIVAQGAGNIVSGNGSTAISNIGSSLISNSAGGAVAAAPMAKAAGAPAMAADAAVAETSIARAPMPSASAAPGNNGGSVGGGAFSGNVWSYYGFQGYFGGYGDQQMALVSLQQAQLPGNKGSFAEIVGGTCAPIVKAWASDARLINSSATIDNNGALLPADNNTMGGGRIGIAVDSAIIGGSGGYGDPNGWSLTYASSKRTEVLTFTVTPAKTTVIRMRWEPLNLDPARVTTDSGAAVRKLIAAIEDKSFKGEEESSGKDYFLGFPFDQPKTGQWDGDYQHTEVVYKVDAKARWNVSLQEVMGKLVWQANYWAPYENNDVVYAKPMISAAGAGVAAVAPDDAKIAPEPQPIKCETKVVEQEGWFNNSAEGMVDAETGKVIRFSRPTRTTYKNTVESCSGPTPIAVPATTTVAPVLEKK